MGRWTGFYSLDSAGDSALVQRNPAATHAGGMGGFATQIAAPSHRTRETLLSSRVHFFIAISVKMCFSYMQKETPYARNYHRVVRLFRGCVPV